MKFLLAPLCIFLFTIAVYADYPAESYGADPSTADNSVPIQKALDEAGVDGGGTVTVTKPGVYLLKTQGANPYMIRHKYCLEIHYDNITLSLGKGVILKLDDLQQTDEPVDIIIFQSKNNLTFTGGTITGNAAGQSWGGGYAQISNGIIISSYSTFFTGSSNIVLENTALKNHFSNSVNISVCGGCSARNKNIYIDRVTSLDCGEGIEVISGDNVWITDSTVDSPNHVAVGDAFEVSGVNWFHIIGDTARNHKDGSGFDIFASRNGIVQNFIAESCANGIAVHPFPYPGGETEDILVDGGLITAPPGTIFTDGVQVVGPNLKNVTFAHIKIKGTPYSVGFRSSSYGPTLNFHGPVSILDCEVSGASDGMSLYPISELTIRGGNYSNNTGRGIVLLYIAGLVSADVAELRIDGVIARNNGSWGIVIDRQGNTVPLLTGSIQNSILTNNGTGALSTGNESANLVIRNNVP